MRPQISRLLSPIYPELIDHPSTFNRPAVVGLAHPAYFLTHQSPERTRGDLISPENPHEVEVLCCLAALLVGSGYAPEKITVLSAYVGQLIALRAGFAACGLDGLVLSTVDAYQGEENDIVLLSLVRSNSDGRPSFTARRPPCERRLFTCLRGG